MIPHISLQVILTEATETQSLQQSFTRGFGHRKFDSLGTEVHALVLLLGPIINSECSWNIVIRDIQLHCPADTGHSSTAIVRTRVLVTY